MKTKTGEILVILAVLLFSSFSEAGRFGTQLRAELKCTMNLAHKNSWNKTFWDLFTEEMFLERIDSVGLTDAQDVKMTMPFLLPLEAQGNARVLEIGANYGRVVDKIIESTRSIHVDAVEYSTAAQRLKERYKDNSRVRVFYDSVLKMHMEPQTYDGALLLFAGFYEFSMVEKSRLFVKIRRALKPGGFLIIDNPDVPSIGRVGDPFPSRIVKAPHPDHPNVFIRGYLLTNNEIFKMLLEHGFNPVTCTSYPVGDKYRVNCIARK